MIIKENMIINIDGDDLESLEQLKGYFNPDPTPDSHQVFADLLDYGQHGDLSGWLREHGEEGMASRVDAIQEGLSDSKYYAALKQVVTGKTMEDDGGMKPSFERCCHLEGVDCDIEGSEAKIKVRLRVLMSVNEEYRLEVKSGWGERDQKMNPSQYTEGDTATIEFVLKKESDQGFENIVVMGDGKKLYNKKVVLDGESLDFEVGRIPLDLKQTEEFMTAKELYEAGCSHRSRAMENTQYTHVHSVDIENDVFENYFLPSAKEGYPPAIIEVAKHYINQGEKSKAYSWMKVYKKQTNCTRRELAMVFGPSFLFGLI